MWADRVYCEVHMASHVALGFQNGKSHRAEE